MNILAKLVVKEMVDIEEAVDEQWPKLRENYPTVFAGLCRDACRMYGARTIARAVGDVEEQIKNFCMEIDDTLVRQNNVLAKIVTELEALTGAVDRLGPK